MKKRKKRGGLAVKTLITIILLVIGFSIILFLYYQIDWTGRVDREVCHQSVIYRATLPAFAGVKEYVPLKCKTQKMCMTTGFIGGECKEFENVKGVAKIKVKKGEEGKRQIERAITQEIVECWTMMGEGKVAVFGSWMAEYGIGGVGSSCVVCSRIAFDKEKLEEAGIKLEEIDVMEYMRKYAVPDKDISYYDYLVGEGGQVSVKEKLDVIDINDIDFDNEGNIESFGEESSTVELKSPVGDSDSIDEIGIIFMQISAPSNSDVFRRYLETLGIGFGSSFVLAPHIAVTTLKSPITWALLIALGVYQQGNTIYNRAVTAGYCGDISTGREARDGCSVVRMVNYDKKDLSQYCSIIESIS